MERESHFQIFNSSDSPPLPSEPPDVRNWFPSYKYESFVLDTYDDALGGGGSDSERNRFVDSGDKIREEKEENLGQNSNSEDRNEDPSLDKIPDAIYSASLVSEPPDIKEWFSSYEYESPVLDESGDFTESGSKKGSCEKENTNIEEREKILEEFNSGNSGEVVAGEKSSNWLIKCTSPLACVPENEPLRKIPHPSQSSSFLSEPPDLRNWFCNYVYESNEFVNEEIGDQEDDLIPKDSYKEEELNFRKLIQNRLTDVRVDNEEAHANGYIKFSNSSVDDKQEIQSLIKEKRVVGNKNLCTGDNFPHEREQIFEDTAVAKCGICPTKRVEKSILKDNFLCQQQQQQNCCQECFDFKSNMQSTNVAKKVPTKLFSREDFPENLEAKAQREGELMLPPRSNSKFIQVTGASMRKSTQRSSDKENEREEILVNDFTRTRKKRENSYSRQQEVLPGCSKNMETTLSDGEKDVVKRKVLLETTNCQHSDTIELTGKWRCPQKSKPKIGPPQKQLRLERWIKRL